MTRAATIGLAILKMVVFGAVVGVVTGAAVVHFDTLKTLYTVEIIKETYQECMKRQKFETGVSVQLDATKVIDLAKQSHTDNQ